MTIINNDYAQSFLSDYLRETEHIFYHALRKLDSTAECRITPAADLCFPHDVIRLAGGFATGCLVEWRSRVPVVPIDTTVNIDTTSIFYISERVEFSSERFESFKKSIEERSSYEWNFNKGNHFISYCRRKSDGAPALVIHSNEKEFKYQFNGLMPVKDNWYMDSVHTTNVGSRYLRLLIGEKCATFYRIAKMLENYNIVRHAFVARSLIGDRSTVVNEYHKNHYFMPGPEAVAIGCYLCTKNEVVPVLSAPGNDICLFQVHSGGNNKLRMLGGKETFIVPHGFGKTSNCPVTMHASKDTLEINGISFENTPKSSIGLHPALCTRYSTDDPQVFFDDIKHHTPGMIVDRFEQIQWYNKNGFGRNH